MKFEIYRSGTEYRFRAKGDNGEIVAASEGYRDKASAQATIDMIKREAPAAKVDDLT